ncbi:ArsR/SmtB family transcription factor [Tateyamaria sp.]|uniref:ArsR/SmtB family transcription factor n=1 Tax=Tateyamaria sp. TaxID=1929288 RepID=UPI003B221C77
MDALFKALSDPARRILLDSLRSTDGQTLQQLQGQLDMTRFGVMKHLGVLEEAGLITTKKVGRFKHHYLNALPLQEAIDRWIEPLLVKPAARAVLDLKSKLEGHETMTKPDFVMQTYIRCTQDALWAALTEASAHAAYNFMCQDVRRDGDALHFQTPDGNEMLVCRETALDPKTRIASTFEPKWAPGVPVSQIVYLIAVEGPFCALTLEHYNIPPAAADGIADGWARTLSGLKTWLETGESAKFLSPQVQ